MNSRGCLIVRDLDRTPYAYTWRRMRHFTDRRNATTPDELWLTEHDPVYTLGQAGNSQHLLNETDIPVVHCDRGGQVTYHGPGQLVAYYLCDIKRANLSVHEFVCRLEDVLIHTLCAFAITGQRLEGSPGIYVQGSKIGSLGLRVRRGCVYHGISFNIDMDLKPFGDINPCGMEGMRVTQLRALLPGTDLQDVKPALVQSYKDIFQFENVMHMSGSADFAGV